MKLHPYALIIGLGIGVLTLFALRHPLFALFAGLIATLGLDLVFKARISEDDKDNQG
jgi:energy-coupling factor transporter transmembrane protein EcfT